MNIPAASGEVAIEYLCCGRLLGRVALRDQEEQVIFDAHPQGTVVEPPPGETGGLRMLLTCPTCSARPRITDAYALPLLRQLRAAVARSKAPRVLALDVSSIGVSRTKGDTHTE